MLVVSCSVCVARCCLLRVVCSWVLLVVCCLKLFNVRVMLFAVFLHVVCLLFVVCCPLFEVGRCLVFVVYCCLMFIV